MALPGPTGRTVRARVRPALPRRGVSFVNRMDRLLAIIWLLRSRGKMKAEELAAVFGVTPRSIYRDIQALAEANVPIVSLPGPDGGYSLMKEYAVSPITFTDEQIAALFLGASFLRATGLDPFRTAVDEAMAKIARVLPPKQVQRLEALRRSILPDFAGGARTPEEAQFFRLVHEGLVGSRRLQAEYRNLSGEITSRSIDPYGLIFQSGRWYVVGHCHLRGAIRMFRIDRFRKLALSEERFERPADFPLDPFLFRAAEEEEFSRPRVRVRLEADERQRRYLFEHPYFCRCNPQEVGESSVVLDVPEPSVPWLVDLVLEGRGRLRVIEPESVAEAVRQAAAAVHAAHGGGSRGAATSSGET